MRKLEHKTSGGCYSCCSLLSRVKIERHLLSSSAIRSFISQQAIQAAVIYYGCYWHASLCSKINTMMPAIGWGLSCDSKRLAASPCLHCVFMDQSLFSCINIVCNIVSTIALLFNNSGNTFFTVCVTVWTKNISKYNTHFHFITWQTMDGFPVDFVAVI